MPAPQDIRPRTPTVEVVDDEMAAILRTKTGAQRLAIAAGMFRSARTLVEQAVRHDHPGWSDDAVRREVSRRLSHGTA